VIAILAGALIIAHLPSSADWAIGLLVGITIHLGRLVLCLPGDGRQ
jgi:hypothetical protein